MSANRSTKITQVEVPADSFAKTVVMINDFIKNNPNDARLWAFQLRLIQNEVKDQYFKYNIANGVTGVAKLLLPAAAIQAFRDRLDALINSFDKNDPSYIEKISLAAEVYGEVIIASESEQDKKASNQSQSESSSSSASSSDFNAVLNQFENFLARKPQPHREIQAYFRRLVVQIHIGFDNQNAYKKALEHASLGLALGDTDEEIALSIYSAQCYGSLGKITTALAKCEEIITKLAAFRLSGTFHQVQMNHKKLVTLENMFITHESSFALLMLSAKYYESRRYGGLMALKKLEKALEIAKTPQEKSIVTREKMRITLMMSMAVLNVAHRDDEKEREVKTHAPSAPLNNKNENEDIAKKQEKKRKQQEREKARAIANRLKREEKAKVRKEKEESLAKEQKAEAERLAKEQEALRQRQEALRAKKIEEEKRLAKRKEKALEDLKKQKLEKNAAEKAAKAKSEAMSLDSADKPRNDGEEREQLSGKNEIPEINNEVPADNLDFADKPRNDGEEREQLSGKNEVPEINNEVPADNKVQEISEVPENRLVQREMPRNTLFALSSQTNYYFVAEQHLALAWSTTFSFYDQQANINQIMIHQAHITQAIQCYINALKCNQVPAAIIQITHAKLLGCQSLLAVYEINKSEQQLMDNRDIFQSYVITNRLDINSDVNLRHLYFNFHIHTEQKLMMQKFNLAQVSYATAVAKGYVNPYTGVFAQNEESLNLLHCQYLYLQQGEQHRAEIGRLTKQYIEPEVISYQNRL
jgi:hypothetical protein